MYLLSHSLRSINEWGQLSLMKRWEAVRSRLRAKEREKEGASLIKITRVETPSISLHPTTVIRPNSNIPQSTNQINTTWTYIMSARFLHQCAHAWIKTIQCLSIDIDIVLELCCCGENAHYRLCSLSLQKLFSCYCIFLIRNTTFFFSWAKLDLWH